MEIEVMSQYRYNGLVDKKNWYEVLSMTDIIIMDILISLQGVPQ